MRVCICTGDNIPADSLSLFQLIYPHLSSFPSPIATTSLLSSITDPFVPPCLSSLPVITSLVHDHPSPPHPLVPHLCPPPPPHPFTFARRVTALEAVEQRNCLLSRVDFSGAPKLLCIDTLSEQGCQSGPGHSQTPVVSLMVSARSTRIEGVRRGAASSVCVCV